MALTTALNTALTGLDVNSKNLDVIGNNIANVNTHGYKASRALFSTQLSSTMSTGSPPMDASGGTNPKQIGLGAMFSTTFRNMQTGAIQPTGINTDLALEGPGFFMVEQDGQTMYTRDGAFSLDSRMNLTTSQGFTLQGFGVDANYNIVPAGPKPINLPLGSLTIAEATQNVNFAGNLNASGAIATTGSEHTSRAFYTDAALTPGNEVTGAEDLTVPGNDLYIDNGAGGSFLAFEGGTDTVITVADIEKGGKSLGTKSFAFTDAATAATLGVDDFGSTLADFAEFLDDALGLDNNVMDGESFGGSVSLVGGKLVVKGNEGTIQDLDISSGHMIASNTVNGIHQPFVMTRDGYADGESLRTTFVAYDSLGTPLNIDLSMTLQSVQADGGTKWGFTAESTDNDSVDRMLGFGVLQFDSLGQFVSASNQSISLTRENGAVSPLTMNLNFSSESEAISSLTDTRSQIASTWQDGSSIGTLDDFGIGENGIITGVFSNGMTRQLGQVVLATFTNPAGLIDAGGSMFEAGPNSGTPIHVEPQSFGVGRIISGALELSNVDLGQEFVNMITASTGFSAASRVITTSDELIQQLLALVR